MHIVVVDSTITTPPTGGAHTFLVELCTALVGRGHRVTLVTEPGPDQSLTNTMQMACVEVIDAMWRSVDLPEERAARLAAWVNGNRADVYVVSVSPDAGWLAVPLLESRVGTVSVTHSDGPTFYEPLKHYSDFVDCAVGVSQETARKIVSYCGVPTARAHHIPYGVGSLTPAEAEARIRNAASRVDPLRVAYVGRLVQSQKRVLDLVPLAEEMRRRGVKFELHVIGEGPERRQLEKGFAAAGLNSQVTFWGWLRSNDVKRRLQELDVLVLLSELEGLPVAMLEAMGHGVVPVVTRIESGAAELVSEGVNGFLVNVGDFATFADRFAELERDRARLATMSQAAWETSRAYTVERMVERYLELFNEIRSGDSTRPRVASGYPVMRSCVSPYPFWLRKIKRRVLVATGRGHY
ncbi:MAG: glycosyltransferase family 4 protein [Pyrinomonadaceae bacterium]